MLVLVLCFVYLALSFSEPGHAPRLDGLRRRAGSLDRRQSRHRQHCLARGYQGQTFSIGTTTAPGDKGSGGRASASGSPYSCCATRRAYTNSSPLLAAPRCYGLLHNRYLVLEFIDGAPARYAGITDREAFFGELLEQIKTLHALGVAHSDLQKKDNLLLVMASIRACSTWRRRGPQNRIRAVQSRSFSPRRASRFQPVWQIKYQGRFEQMSTADRVYFRAQSLRSWHAA